MPARKHYGILLLQAESREKSGFNKSDYHNSWRALLDFINGKAQLEPETLVKHINRGIEQKLNYLTAELEFLDKILELTNERMQDFDYDNPSTYAKKYAKAHRKLSSYLSNIRRRSTKPCLDKYNTYKQEFLEMASKRQIAWSYSKVKQHNEYWKQTFIEAEQKYFKTKFLHAKSYEDIDGDLE